MQESQVRSLGWEDLLEKVMATHSRILAWTILWTVEPGGLQSMEVQRAALCKDAAGHAQTHTTSL